MTEREQERADIADALLSEAAEIREMQSRERNALMKMAWADRASALELAARKILARAHLSQDGEG